MADSLYSVTLGAGDSRSYSRFSSAAADDATNISQATAFKAAIAALVTGSVCAAGVVSHGMSLSYDIAGIPNDVPSTANNIVTVLMRYLDDDDREYTEKFQVPYCVANETFDWDAWFSTHKDTGGFKSTRGHNPVALLSHNVKPMRKLK